MPFFTGKGLDVINKATGGVVMTSASASDADVDTAVKSAHAAYQKFRDMPAAERGQLLLKAGEVLKMLGNHDVSYSLSCP